MSYPRPQAPASTPGSGIVDLRTVTGKTAGLRVYEVNINQVFNEAKSIRKPKDIVFTLITFSFTRFLPFVLLLLGCL